MRERRIRKFSEIYCVRITPACAGKTRVQKCTLLPAEDHPRMCGKDFGFNQPILAQIGSPPHVRERRRHDKDGNAQYGITPACAGKTPGGICHGPSFWDHPRMCGKDAGLSYRGSSARGSPPHVRERPSRRSWAFCKGGITPACAGKTPSS